MNFTNPLHRKTGRILRTALAGLFITLVFQPTALADSCWLDVHIKSMKNPDEFLVSISEVIFVGKAIAKTTETFEHIDEPELKHIFAERTTFEIESVTKGDLEVGKNINVDGKTSDCSCIGNFTLGEKYLVHATIDDKSGKLILRYCAFGKKIE